MPKYRIERIDQIACSAIVTADSESAAPQGWTEGDFDYEERSHTETGNPPSFEVVEE